MDKHIKLFTEQIEAAIRYFVPGDHPQELYEPIRYILSHGGKRLRPLLTLLTYAQFQPDTDKVIRPAISVEVFHNFTLMHDDIMDKAPIRRGSTTVHKKWNENIAILSGDVMLIKAYELLTESPGEFLKRAIQRFGITASEVCEGQQLDMNFEQRLDVTIDEYLEMIRLKTAVLIGYSMELGALLAGGDPETCRKFREAGTNIGMGFQLMDDLLDVYADKSKFGKQIGGDILANKKTYLLIKALEQAKGKTRETLLGWLTVKEYDPVDKIAVITDVYDRLHIHERTNEAILSFYHRGIRQLDEMISESEVKKSLLVYIDKLLNREK